MPEADIPLHPPAHVVGSCNRHAAYSQRAIRVDFRPVNLLFGFLITGGCLVIEAVIVMVAMGFYTRREHLIRSPSILSTLFVMIAVIATLFIGSCAQIGLWALFFQRLGEFSNYQDALYHSAVNFSSLGYGDIVMSRDNRLLGPLEAINGILMVGVSSAVLITALQDAIRQTLAARKEAAGKPH